MNELDKAQEGSTIWELADRYLRQLRRLWAVILALTVLCSAFLAVRSKRSFTPMYEATARFSVSSSYDGDDIFGAFYYNSSAAQQLAAASALARQTRQVVIPEVDTYVYGVIDRKSVV